MIEVLGVKNADKLVPTTDDAKPTDPVSENMDALVGKPLKAFIYQDHEAHIATHQAFMQDPVMMQMIGQNPPPPNEQLPEQVEVNLAKLVADAGKQLTQQKQQQVAQQQAQQKAQDPVVQMQQAELQIKQQEVQRKAAKDQLDAQLKQAELELKARENMQDAQIDQAELAIKQQELQIDAQKAGAKLAADRRKDNTKLDLDLLKTIKDSNNSRGQ
jgi:septal ring factor EnvC (AmiA/AmiB activator)